MNPTSKKSRRAVIMFDSGSSSSHVSSKLAQCLDLPRHEMRVQHVSTFGSDTPLVFNGFRTFLVLCSKHGRSIQVNVTVLDRIVSSVRTALVRDADLSALRSGDCVPTPTREMPDLLIGQDLVHFFDRHLDPTLPCGFYIVQTSMGPTIGGARLSVRRPPKASSTSPPAALAATQDTDTIKDTSRWSLPPTPSKFKRSSSRLHFRLPELAAYRDRDSDDKAMETGRGSPVPAHNAGLEPSDVGGNEENEPELPAHNAGALDFPRAEPPEIPAHNAGSGGFASQAVTTTTAASDRPSGPRKKKEASPEAKPPAAQAAPAAQLTEEEPALLGFQRTDEQSAVVSSSSSGPVDTADPTAPPALTTELCRELTKDEIMIHDSAPGVKLRVLSILLDSTSSTAPNTTKRSADNGPPLESGKCLSLGITKNQNAGDVDLHDEARKALHKIENGPANNAGDTAVHNNHKCLGSSTSTSFSSRQPLQPSRVSSALPLSPQKQSSTNPLDAQLLLLPAHSITNVEVEEVTAAHNAAGPPRPTQEPLSSMEAKLHCSSPSPPTYGNMIRAPLHDAGSHHERKTRLRCRLPVHIRQPLGIYAARKLVFTVLPLPQLEPTYFHLLGAEHGQKRVLMSSQSPQTTTMLRTRLSQHLRVLFHAVLLRDGHVAVLCDYRATLQQHDATVTDWQRMLNSTGSRHDCLRWLRSPRSLPNARTRALRPAITRLRPLAVDITNRIRRAPTRLASRRRRLPPLRAACVSIRTRRFLPWDLRTQLSVAGCIASLRRLLADFRHAFRNAFVCWCFDCLLPSGSTDAA
ncbi:hypothetical protein AAVH_14353 [Aphelenchoides avenae]|nr:hypothetical protein AAVH_14353 [Aphelenchus avenae]